MESFMLNLADLDMDQLSSSSEVNIREKKEEPRNLQVAIIGMSGKVGAAENLDEFWNMLVQEKEGFSRISKERKEDILEYLRCRGVEVPIDENRYISGAHMKRVDQFDYNFFSISHQEAIGMDPNQRVFLQTAWEALEDAGYASEAIKGTDTGVFVGLSSDFGDPYRDFIQVVAPDAPEIMVSGNVKSMIAGRLAYQLDLRGPSMLIDTACSSGLVAVYNAMRYLQNRECSMAIAGGVKIDMLPVLADTKTGVGIKDIQATANSDGHTKTFDDNCEGTSTAEGAFAFVFKLLEDAIRDRDQIHAVLMGGAVNQDGASNGITAPNVDAQCELIEKAIADSGVDANQISYIEAHGTATKLGDPIEVKGIERAFKRYTNRKQFVGISSVKTNIGHLDNVSGLAGLAKVVLSMKNRILPASLNFEQPNHNISFMQSPVYVLDRTTDWSEEEEVFAGINSFGLSGTNCHLIVKSADKYLPKSEPAKSNQTFLLPLSAKNQASLKRLVEKYFVMLSKKAVDLQNLTYSVAIGRVHLNCRVCFMFTDQDELLTKLERYLKEELANEESVMQGEFRVVSEEADKVRANDITESERNSLSMQSKKILDSLNRKPGPVELVAIAKAYIRGANVSWELLFDSESVNRISLPTYPFEQTRCWIKTSNGKERKQGMLYKEQAIESYHRFECITTLTAERFWELNEHRIHGYCVLPGTGLIELLIEAAGVFHLNQKFIQLEKIMFENPLIVKDDEEKRVHIIFIKKDSGYTVQIASKNANGDWEENAQAELLEQAEQSVKRSIPVKEIAKNLPTIIENDKDVDVEKGLIISDRWTGSFVKGKANESLTEFLLEFKLPDKYKEESMQYCIHPALMDVAINAVNNIVDDSILFLPFSYGQMKLYHPLQSHIFAHFKKKAEYVEGMMHSFHVTLTDAQGNVLMDIQDYSIKSAMNIALPSEKQYGYKRGFKKIEKRNGEAARTTGKVLIYGKLPSNCMSIGEELESRGYQCIRIEEGREQTVTLESLQGEEFEFGIFSAAYFTEKQELQNEDIIEPAKQAFAFIKKLAEYKLKFHNGITAITCDACMVDEEQEMIHPGQVGLIGIWKVASLEFENLSLYCMDIDENTSVSQVAEEVICNDRKQTQYYRKQNIYTECIKREDVKISNKQLPVNHDGIVVISGGTGDLGTELALYLARSNAKKLILLGSKNAKSDRKEWEELKSICTVFQVLHVDIKNGDEVKEQFQHIRKKYGKIAGVIHLAGKAGDGFIYAKTMEQFMDVYQTKALGAFNLHQAVQEDSLEFFIEFSSIASLLIQAGQSDYTAANMVLDSLAEYRTLHHMPSLSIQWPAWRETGIAKRMGAVDEEEEFQPLDTDEALQLFKALLSQKTKSCVIMPGMRKEQTNGNKDKEVRQIAVNQQRDITIYGIKDPDDIDRQVASVWAETLEINEIDGDDDFNDLGGNSLLNTQMLKLYETKFPGVFDITDLFKFTTIVKQSQYIKESLGLMKQEEIQEKVESADNDLDQLLTMLENGEISLEDTKKILL